MSILRTTLATLLLLAACHASPAAEPAEAGAIDRLLDKYGKDKVVDLILRKRSGSITIAAGKATRDFRGRPNMDYVTAASIANDLRMLHTSPGEVESELAAGGGRQTASLVDSLTLDELRLQVQEKAAEIAKLQEQVQQLQALAKKQEHAKDTEKTQILKQHDDKDKQLQALREALRQREAEIASLTQGLALTGFGAYLLVLGFAVSKKAANLRARIADFFVYGKSNCQKLYRDELLTLLFGGLLVAAYFAALLALIPSAIGTLWAATASATILFFAAIYAVRHRLPPKPSLITGSCAIVSGLVGLIAGVPYWLAEPAPEGTALLAYVVVAPRETLLLGLYLALIGGNMVVEARAKKAREAAFREGRNWWR